MNAITAFFVCVGSQNLCLLEKPSHSSHHTYTEFHMNKFYPHLKCVCVCGLPPLYNVKNENCDNNISNNNNMS